MKVSRRVFVGGAGAVALAAPFVSRARAAEFEYRMGHPFPQTYPIHVHAVAAADAIRQRSSGRVDIQVFGNSQLGGDTDMISQVRSGAIQLYSSGGLILSTLVPVAGINGMGFAFDGYDTVWRALDGDLGAHIRAGFAKAGLHAFERCWDNGFRQISSSTHPINTPDDLRNFKIRVPVSPLYTSLFKALGGAPTSINFSETYSALQTRIVDGQENPIALVAAAKLYEVQKYVSLTNHVWDGSWVLMNAKAWAALSPDLQAIVTAGFNEAAVAERAASEKASKTVQVELTEKGLAFNTVEPGPFRDRLRQAGFYRSWADKYGPEAWGLLEKNVGQLT
jgi:tripartite ATP-independent transporter DctP family solute receptor